MDETALVQGKFTVTDARGGELCSGTFTLVVRTANAAGGVSKQRLVRAMSSLLGVTLPCASLYATHPMQEDLSDDDLSADILEALAALQTGGGRKPSASTGSVGSLTHSPRLAGSAGGASPARPHGISATAASPARKMARVASTRHGMATAVSADVDQSPESWLTALAGAFGAQFPLPAVRAALAGEDDATGAASDSDDE